MPFHLHFDYGLECHCAGLQSTNCLFVSVWSVCLLDAANGARAGVPKTVRHRHDLVELVKLLNHQFKCCEAQRQDDVSYFSALLCETNDHGEDTSSSSTRLDFFGTHATDSI